MGQYYNVVIGSTKTDRNLVYNVRVGTDWNGMKLLEHSYWENCLLKAVGARLRKYKTRVAWVGDYAENEELTELNIPLDMEHIWGDAARIRSFTPTEFDINKVKYLVNFSKNEYVDLKDYYERSKYTWEGFNEETYTECIHPLPLLTAVGNDRGGGDYHRGASCYDEVGRWAWDVIALTNHLPEDCEKLDIYFREEHRL